jgi:glutaredoxin-related protein
VKISVDPNKKQVTIYFRGELSRANLCGYDEVILVSDSGAFLDSAYIDMFYLDEIGGDQRIYIDRPTYPKPWLYIERYLGENNNPITNKQAMTW